MKSIVTLIISLLMATAICAQPFLKPEPLPLEKDLSCAAPQLLIPFNGKLVFTGSHKDTPYHKYLLEYDGANPAHIVPDAAMQKKNFRLGHLIHVETPPKGQLFFKTKDSTALSSGIFAYDGEKIDRILTVKTLPSVIDYGYGIGNKIYYLYHRYDTIKNSKNLMMLDLEEKTRHKLTYYKYLRAMVVSNEKIYLFDFDSIRQIHCYNTQTDSITEIATGINDNDKLFSMAGHTTVGNTSYLIIETAKRGKQLYEFDGVHPLKQTTHYPKGRRVGIHSISPQYNGKLYFSATTNDSSKYADLYSYNPTTGKIELVHNFGMNGGIATSFCIAKGKLYFTAQEQKSGRQLYTYDSTNNKVTRITNYKDERSGLSLSPINLVVFKDRLYFCAFPTQGYDMYSADGIFMLPQIADFAPFYSIPLR